MLEVCAGPDLVPPRASGMTDELVEYPGIPEERYYKNRSTVGWIGGNDDYS